MTFAASGGGFNLDPGGVVAWIVIGLLAGALASRVVTGRGLGCVADLVVGVAGAFIGGVILSLFAIQGVARFWGSLVVAFIGACLLLAVLQLIAGRRL